MKRTVTAAGCAALALTIFVPPAAAEPPSGEEVCQMVGGNGGTYYLDVTSKAHNDLSQCAVGMPLQAGIDDLLGNPAYGTNMDRRCIYDMTTDPTVDAIVGVYSSDRASDRAAADAVCQLHHGSN